LILEQNLIFPWKILGRTAAQSNKKGSTFLAAVTSRCCNYSQRKSIQIKISIPMFICLVIALIWGPRSCCPRKERATVGMDLFLCDFAFCRWSARSLLFVEHPDQQPRTEIILINKLTTRFKPNAGMN
jgi:hypothetical protein